LREICNNLISFLSVYGRSFIKDIEEVCSFLITMHAPPDGDHLVAPSGGAWSSFDGSKIFEFRLTSNSFNSNAVGVAGDDGREAVSDSSSAHTLWFTRPKPSA